MQCVVITDLQDRPQWTSFDDFQKLLGIQFIHDKLTPAFYDIIDHQLFFLSVIKYGITFVDGDKYEWVTASGDLRNRHRIIKHVDEMQ